MKITAVATQSENWWAVEVPDIGFMTQAKRLTEVEEMARSLVADVRNIDPTDIEVEVTVLLPYKISNALDEAKTKMQTAQAQLEIASKASRSTIKELRTAGFTVREVATLMGLSPGRITQLEHHSPEVPTPKSGITRNVRVSNFVIKADDAAGSILRLPDSPPTPALS